MKVIIVGLGRMGTSLAQRLDGNGHQVVAIDMKPEALDGLGENFKGTKIQGFGFDKETLESAGINRADAVMCCSNSDEVNALIARIAKNTYKVPRVVARLYDGHKEDIYRRLGIQTISTTSWGVDRAIEILSYEQVDSVYEISNGKVELVRIEVPSLLVGRTVNDITRLTEIHVVAISRNHEPFLPTMGTILEAEDVLYIAVVNTANAQLKQMFDLA